MSENVVENVEVKSRVKVNLIQVKEGDVESRMDFIPIEREFFAKMGFAAGDRLGLIQSIRKGVHYNALNVLANSLALSIRDVSHLVAISDRTLMRRKKRGSLSSEESERVYRVGSLVVRATEVLHDHDEAMHWLKTPKKALGDEIPLDLADTEVGADEVKDLLGRIEHGVFS